MMHSEFISDASGKVEVETKARRSVLKPAKVNTTHTTHIVYSGLEENEKQSIYSKETTDAKQNTMQSGEPHGDVQSLFSQQNVMSVQHLSTSQCLTYPSDAMKKHVTFRATPEVASCDTLEALVELTIDDETSEASYDDTIHHYKSETQTQVSKTESPNEPQNSDSNATITNEPDNKNIKTESVKRKTKPISPRRKQCSFQVRGKLGEKDKATKEADELRKRFALPDRMDKHRSIPAANWEMVIADTKRRLERQRRSERPWLHGTEMTSFFHKLWQQDTIGPHPHKSVKRTSSLPRNFKLPDLKIRSRNDPTLDLGIIRECCCSPRSRIRTFSFSGR